MASQVKLRRVTIAKMSTNDIKAKADYVITTGIEMNQQYDGGFLLSEIYPSGVSMDTTLEDLFSSIDAKISEKEGI